MITRAMIVAGLCAAGLLASVAAAATAESADFWDKRRIGGRICLAAHEHYGESPPWPSKRGAMAAAKRAWELSTLWEYGTRWNKYRLAAGKRVIPTHL